MTRMLALLAALWLGVGSAMAQTATGEATLEDYAKAWRMATAALAATASVPMGGYHDVAAKSEAIRRFTDYNGRLNDTVTVLIRLRPPGEPQLLRRHFALLPLFQEAAAASASWLESMQAGGEDDARLAEEWFWSVATRLRTRAEALSR